MTAVPASLDSGRPTAVLASSNPGKLAELQAVLADLDMDVLPQSRFAVPAVAETGLSFVENALIKARHCALHSDRPAIADDSGLVVDALGGAPGIYSARYAGEGAADRANLEKLLQALDRLPPEARTARFFCALVYLRDPRDPMPIICQGVWEGRILDAPRGRHGFGYDPVFYVPEHGCAAAELNPQVKNRVSHRGQALTKLMAALRGE